MCRSAIESGYASAGVYGRRHDSGLRWPSWQRRYADGFGWVRRRHFLELIAPIKAGVTAGSDWAKFMAEDAGPLRLGGGD